MKLILIQIKNLKPYSLINGKFITQNYIQLNNEINCKTCKASYNQNIAVQVFFIIAISACNIITQTRA